MFKVVINVLVGATNLKKKTQQVYLDKRLNLPRTMLCASENPVDLGNKIFLVHFGINLNKEENYSWGLKLTLLDVFVNEDELHIVYYILLPEINNPINNDFGWRNVEDILSEYNENKFIREIVQKFGNKI